MNMNAGCLRCGSDKIIPDVPLTDHFGDWGMTSRQAQVDVHGAPGAFIMRDTATGDLTVRICGSCGHAELVASNAAELWAAHQKSLEQ